MIQSSPFPQPFSSPLAQPFGNSPTRNPKPQKPREESMPRFVNYLADYSGCGHWRILWPEQVINMTQRGLSYSVKLLKLSLSL